MANFYDYSDVVKKYFSFEESEVRAMIITSTIIAFCLSFREWGVGDVFDFQYGLFNLFNTFLIVVLALFVHVTSQKLYAFHIGYNIKYEIWVFGLVLSLLLAFLTNGYLFFIAVGGFTMFMLKGHRLGYFRYGLNYFGLGTVALMGAVGNVLLAAFFKFASFASSSPLIHQAIIINLYFAIFSLLPIPPLDGVKVFFASPFLYAFGVGLVLGAASFIYSPNFWLFLIGTILSAFIGLFVMIKIEDPFSVK